MITLKKSSMKYKSADGSMQDVGAILGKEVTDITLSKSGVAADSKAVGDKISKTAIFDPEDNEVIEDNGSSGNDKFVLIESFESTEELSLFERTTEPDGTSYDFKKIKVIVMQPKSIKDGSGGILCNSTILQGNTYHITSINKSFNATCPTFSQYNASIESGFLTGDAVTIIAKEETTDFEAYIQNSAFNPAYVCRTLFDICRTVKLDKIECLVYRSLNSYPIPIGTKIDIYAVRSK